MRAMSVLEFVAAITSALAWPTLGVILLIVFRREPADWMKQRPMRLRVGPAEAEWPRVRSSVEPDLEQAGVPPTLGSGTRGLLHESLGDTAQSASMVAITESVEAVEGR